MTHSLHLNASPIAITQGDPAGVGAETIVLLFQSDETIEISTKQSQNNAQKIPLTHGCFVVGQMNVLRRAAQIITQQKKQMFAPMFAQITQAKDVWNVPKGCIPVLDPNESNDYGLTQHDFSQLPNFSTVNAQAGQQAAQAVQWAARAALHKEIEAIVTAPLHKEALSAAGFLHAGHTELLQEEAARHLNCSINNLPVRMMLSNAELRTVLVSIHVSLLQAIQAINFDSVLSTIDITNRALSQQLHRAPKIAVAGLNPHAGENGLFGQEEIQILQPAIVEAQKQGILVSGAFAPDTIFMRARTGEFDAVIAMYHDQGLIPVKYLGIDHGVNTTLGLPFTRTSPDHGTAFDIAGTGKANPSSLREALRNVQMSLLQK